MSAATGARVGISSEFYQLVKRFALVSLDCFAGMTGMLISQSFLKEIEPLFGAYLKQAPLASDNAA